MTYEKGTLLVYSTPAEFLSGGGVTYV